MVVTRETFRQNLFYFEIILCEEEHVSILVKAQLKKFDVTDDLHDGENECCGNIFLLITNSFI